ncbi:hypothetical protein BN7_5875 [Wickerhamomyces ciferrii]|uniref:Protein transport protein SEC23 n=1 Tax=Wickerhamomyces ciferrii (strain ATCC 14091 / BCRC 22168 / CBS 111 / JCM 3599 / NBRC 0793 / NRRL Y-1031 F-60-10) TaxID=1206466 RepID=K0KYY4_WICCF|nr:uncharacterized protein BN7_5875 [Wickerhamomyces ciferrii]CCH46283.1 hypothetical protein BN7_5875 [Wickerhamomyces ciferrii]
MSDFVKDTDGVRFNWNTFPVTRTEEDNITVPIGCVYTPLKQKDDLSIIQRQPFRCINCQGVMNPFCLIDAVARTWACAICLTRNKFQTNYDIGHVLDEMDPTATTVEYLLPDPSPSPLLFVYVIDLTLESIELDALKSKIIENLVHHPSGSYVALITFDSTVQLHELGLSSEWGDSFIFQGKKDYSTKDIQKYLGMSGNGSRFFNPANLGVFNKIFIPINHESLEKLIQVIKSVQPVSPPTSSNRPERCTGSALAVASSLIEGSFKDATGHILAFIGGPCTLGEGKVVDISKSKVIRTFHDIKKKRAKHLKSATKFYEKLALRASINEKHEKIGKDPNSTSIYSISIFTSGYDQPGTYEMSSLTTLTGGLLILADSFTTNIFKESFNKIFDVTKDGYNDIKTRGSLTVLTSQHLKVAGLIGKGSRLERYHGSENFISDVPIGQGLTNVWSLPLITSKHNYSLFFHVNTVGHSSEKRGIPKHLCIQFQTVYKHPDGYEHLRVTTLKKSTTNDSRIDQNFDQEATTVLALKLFTYQLHNRKLEYEEALNKLDQELISLCESFAIYIPEEPNSFKLSEKFSLLPQFNYNAKKSPILTNFNTTPDESTYYYDLFQKASVDDSLTMIQPTLSLYTATNPAPHPVLLDSNSLSKEGVLLMDSFFHVMIHVGEIAAAWRDSNLDSKEYANVYEMLDNPQKDAIEIMKSRFPLPRFIVTDEGKSQARFLLSRLNPSNNDQNTNFALGQTQDGKEIIYTEDMSLIQYFNRLRSAVVKRK